MTSKPKNEKQSVAAKTYKKRLRQIEKMTQDHFDAWIKAMDDDVKELCAKRNRPVAKGKRKRSAKKTDESAKEKKAKTSTKPERKKKPTAKAKEPEKARVYIP